MTDGVQSSAIPSVLTYDDVRSLAPALEHYTKEALLNGLWKRTELSPRDRSIVTVAALIARLQTIEMPFHFALALDNGVKPDELSEIITHLRFIPDGPTQCLRLPLRRRSSMCAESASINSLLRRKSCCL
jgi:4-carboxymuconolactone decarboxylase